MPPAVERIACIAKDPGLAKWIREELTHPRYSLEIVDDTAKLVTALTTGSPPFPQVVIVDLDELSPSEILGLHSLRDGGWFGAIVAIGVAPAELRVSLSIEYAVPPFRPGLLSRTLRELGLSRSTTKMEKLE